jgi:diguanylate cyclase (GGDEF)-like protein
VAQVYVHKSDKDLSHLHLLQLFRLGIVLLTLLFEAIGIFRPMVKQITVYAAELFRLSTHDPLTGLANRRGFDWRCEVELKRMSRDHKPLSIISLDIDFFKKINDSYGHAGGDDVLKALANILTGAVREIDIVARFGGEEFVILLPDTDFLSAVSLAERIRAEIENTNIQVVSRSIRISASIGVADVDPSAGSLEIHLDRADKALYEAKLSGRNRVVSAQPLLSLAS